MSIEGDPMAKKINYAAMFTLRKDGRYQGSYTDDTGRHYVYDRDPERLWEKLQELQRPKEKAKVVFSDMLESWEAEHREHITNRTWANYAPHVSDMREKYGDLTLEEITAADIANDLVRAKAKGYSATVVNTRRSIFRMVFDHAIIKGELRYNPVSSVKLPRGLHRGKRIAPTKEQMNTIFSSVDAPFGLFPFLLICTGLRKSEALALEWEDVDFASKEIHITKSLDYTNGSSPKQKPPKTESGYRTVPIISPLLPYLEKAHASSTSKYIFPSPPSSRGGKGGGIMTERGYEGAWLRYCRTVGLMEGEKPAITAHNLRHGTATLMFELGVDELTTQRILGHSRIEITREIYTELRNDQKIRSVKKFDRGMSKMMSTTKK